jgi:pilus assembly protein CpaF
LNIEARQADATEGEVRGVEEIVRRLFVKDLQDWASAHPDKELSKDGDAARLGFAEKAVREYHARTDGDPNLARLSRVQYLRLQQRLYIAHSPLGPLGDLLELEDVEDIHIDGTRSGSLVFSDRTEPLPATFADQDDLIRIVQRYFEHAGRHIDAANPMGTITLRDGSRLNAILPPTAEPFVITIRKHQLGRFRELEDLAKEGAMPERAVAFLRDAVHARLNVLISGRTGAGKTTIARVLGLEIPEGERTCTLESDRELWLHELRDDFFSLEARAANVEGRGEITLEQLFREALRQRPQRIAVGEVRGAEAAPMLHAMASGHDGSFTTIHAGSPRQALEALEKSAINSGLGSSPQLVRQMISSGVDLVMQVGAYTRGDWHGRRLSGLSLVAGNQEDPEGRPLVLPVCVYDHAGDKWDWQEDILREMVSSPALAKVRDKFELAGINPRRALVEVVKP